jgi:signal transduction histidine kinase
VKALLVRLLSPRTRIGRHALAALFVALAFAMTLALRTVALHTYFILFVPAVMFAAWFGGRAAGLTASALTVVLAATYLLPSDAIVDQLVWLIVAASVTVMTSALTAARRRAENRLSALAAEERERRRAAESVSQVKTDFLAQIAHELRQPLTAIATAVQLLEKTAAGNASQRALGVISRQNEHLRHLVDDLLDLARLQRKDLELRRADVDLCDIIDDVIHMIAPAVSERGIRFVSDVPPCPLVLRADATRVRQIVSNLLSNAVKYTEPGGEIHLGIEQNGNRVVIHVRDTGRGIPPEHLTQIFEMFETGPGQGTGLGVGLAVVKGLTEMHGGSVQAKSAGIGQGSEFIVTLPKKAHVPAA